MTAPSVPEFSKIKEVVTGWSGVRRYLRGGDEGQIVPVVIPKDRRRYGWLFLLGLAVYALGVAIFIGSGLLTALAMLGTVFFAALAALWLWRSAIVEIEQGTTGVLSTYGKITGTLSPGRHYLWWPWQKVEFVVDTATEIPYLAPVAVCPTQENVPLKAIEFFLKFRIQAPIDFVRTIGASNFDLVLSSAVQDAIRQRSRQVRTERAYDLRGGDVGDMQDYLNRQLERYGVRILGANIPDVQLPDQYQQHLATRERVAKELAAYEREWELTRKRRIDRLLMEIERSKKERDARLIEVKEARNKARQDVARMLEEKETEAQRVRLEIETRGRAALTEAENEATALRRLGQSHRDNRAMVQYELALRRVEVGERLVQHAPRPLLVRGVGGESSPLSTLLLARMLPQLAGNGPSLESAREVMREARREFGEDDEG
ncbi:MAG TPA: SPFH domain-containing protein [Rubrobacteraceae bacterium]|nr:SPFH domain-containing protein [Rubrobacteraceae bacterium]